VAIQLFFSAAHHKDSWIPAFAGMTGVPMQYYEDLEIGRTQKYGSKLVTREEVLEFAAKYDPQPFHLSDEAAAKTHFGRISASGWHSCAMVMAMMVENLTANKQAGLGSPGLDELRWHKPVYPGDTLRVESTLIDKRRSASKPEMGIMRATIAVFNQAGEKVMSFTSIGLIATREPRGGDTQ
jgi:acyl dehydratase